jgi:hypothetical protein
MMTHSVLGAVVPLFARIAALLGLLAVLLWPRPARRVPHAVFVRASAQAVWNTYFMHVERAEYRPGRRILNIERLSESPLTIRATIRMDYAASPSVLTYAFPLYEPPRRYRLEPVAAPGNPLTRGFGEAGELVEQDGGTWLRMTVQVPRGLALSGWLAGRRIRQNLRALAAYCEGRPVPPQRPPMRLPGSGTAAGIAVILVLALDLPRSITVPVVVVAVPFLLWRAWDVARRF